VTELIQPLVAEPGAAGRTAPPAPTFAELVYAHFRWWRSLRTDGAEPDDGRYESLRARFEREHGRILHVFWSSHVESAVALVERSRAHRWQRREFAFYRESDWATKDEPDVASEIHRCDEIAVRAESVLTGVRQRICLQLVVAAASHLLSLVDRASAHEEPAAIAAAIDRERKAIDDAAVYYRQAANGQAQIAYFLGMAFAAVVISAGAGVALLISFHVAVAALIAGAIGGVVSVTQRINAGDFELDYDVGRPYAFFLGSLRPLIGGAFAIAIAFAFTSGITHLPISASDHDANRNLAIVVVSFVAGFSERWAQDTLATAVPRSAPAPAPEAPKPTS
jgi:hypothetical protein